jgi:hypothetical protein
MIEQNNNIYGVSGIGSDVGHPRKALLFIYSPLPFLLTVFGHHGEVKYIEVLAVHNPNCGIAARYASLSFSLEM